MGGRLRSVPPPRYCKAGLASNRKHCNGTKTYCMVIVSHSLLGYAIRGHDHNQPDYADYSGISVVQSILNVSGTLGAHSDVWKFGGNCNTLSTSSWGIHPNMKFMLLLFSFVVQYLCIHL